MQPDQEASFASSSSDEPLEQEHLGRGDDEGDEDIGSAEIQNSPKSGFNNDSMKNSKEMKTSSRLPSSEARPARSLLSRYSKDYYRDDYIVNSVHVVECDSIDAEPCSNGASIHKLSAMRQPQVKPESESLDTNNIIQISISAEQSPDPVNRTGHRKNSTFSDSMSPNVKDNKEGVAATDQPVGKEELDKASPENRNEEMKDREERSPDEAGAVGELDGAPKEATGEERLPVCSLSNEGKSRNSLSLLECSEVLSSGKKPEAFDFLVQSCERELEESNSKLADPNEATPEQRDRELAQQQSSPKATPDESRLDNQHQQFLEKSRRRILLKA